ncbi:MAG TPA: GNAT family N-acetyltransferase [Streptosporangiaceae bacterium]
MTPGPSPLTSPVSGPLSLVVPAGPADADVLSQVIAEAFHALAPSQWLIPDQAARRQILPAYFRIFVDHALAEGVVHTIPSRDAVALWIPAGPAGPAPPAAYPERLAAATGRWAHRFRAFDAALDARHPVGIPHHHLAMLAVRPDKQGQGTGTALLRAHQQTLDRQNMAAYLEASDLRTRQLYLHQGYVLRPNRPIRLPDGGPLMYPMLRKPHHLAAPPTAAASDAPPGPLRQQMHPSAAMPGHPATAGGSQPGEPMVQDRAPHSGIHPCQRHPGGPGHPPLVRRQPAGSC